MLRAAVALLIAIVGKVVSGYAVVTALLIAWGVVVYWATNEQQRIALGGQLREALLAILDGVADFSGVLGRLDAHLVDDLARLLSLDAHQLVRGTDRPRRNPAQARERRDARRMRTQVAWRA